MTNDKTKRQILREYAYDWRKMGLSLEEIIRELESCNYPGNAKTAATLVKNAIDNH